MAVMVGTYQVTMPSSMVVAHGEQGVQLSAVVVVVTGEGTYRERRCCVLVVVIVISGDSGGGRGDLLRTLPSLCPGGGRGDLPGS